MSLGSSGDLEQRLVVVALRRFQQVNNISVFSTAGRHCLCDLSMSGTLLKSNIPNSSQLSQE